MISETSNQTSNLAAVVSSRRPLFKSLGEAWLAGGAHAFGVWNQGQLLAQWPANVIQPSADIVAPIRVGGKMVGELRVAGCSGPAIEARLNAEAQLVAQLVSLESELEGMTAELIELQDQQLALYELTQSTRNHLDLDQTLHSLSREAARLVKAEGALLALSLSDKQPLCVQYPDTLLNRDDVADVYPWLQRRERELVLNSSQGNFKLPRSVRSLLLIPIGIRDSYRAGLFLINKQDGIFNAPDVKLARAIADQAGAQIENVLLYQETLEQARLRTELNVAAQIQLQLLPQRIPRIPGLDLSARSRPALQVGGDFYDLIQQPGQPFVFAVGDVSGKGMSAALLMAMSRTVIRSRANSLATRSPDEIMARVNEDLYDDFTEVSMFATAFIGQYHQSREELVHVNAGHSPVIYCRAGEQPQLLEADGTAIGVLPISLAENHALPFGPGDLLIAATDGFSEARNPADELFGYDRLLQLAAELHEKSAQHISEALFAAVDRFGAGHPQDDDQTLVVVKGVAA